MQAANCDYNATAKYQLGLCYFNGEGIAEDKAEGLRWMHLAAEMSNEEAFKFLFNCYFYGADGVEENKSEGVKWLRRVVDKSQDGQDGDLHHLLGMCYINGEGYDDQAMGWIKSGAFRGYAPSIEFIHNIWRLELESQPPSPSNMITGAEMELKFLSRKYLRIYRTCTRAGFMLMSSLATW